MDNRPASVASLRRLFTFAPEHRSASLRNQRSPSPEYPQRLLEAIVERARKEKLLSEDHFTVDGTLVQAWASPGSFKAKDPATVKGTGARGKKLLRDTHESKTDPEARLYSKGGPSLACYIGHVVTENRNGFVVAACATTASKTAETEAGLKMLEAKVGKAGEKQEEIKTGEEQEETPKKTIGADKAYQNQAFVEGVRKLQLVPHVAEYEPNPKWPNWLTEAERQHPGFRISQNKRKPIEKVFGWSKQGRPGKQIKLRGEKRVDWMFRFVMATQNLVRTAKLIPSSASVLVSVP
ncbi:MAG: transposase [Acidobacteriia bacterium]|nr:transposase [Terriglobia bacterium]